MSNEIYKKNPGKFGPKSVIGRYIRSMNMAQYRDYTYADSDRINFQDGKQEQEKLSQEEKEAREAALRERLENGEISESEYKTLTMTNANDTPAKIETEFLMPKKIDDSYWTDQLTDDDIQYLMLKWGTMYSPEE